MSFIRRKHTVVVRAVIQYRQKILLTRNRGERWGFFPGGQVETGEFALNALARELKEELGIRVQRVKFLGAFDNRFLETSRELHQEIGLVFLVSITGQPKIQEDHLELQLVPMRTLTRQIIYPRGIALAVQRAIKTYRPFWLIEDSVKKQYA